MVVQAYILGNEPTGEEMSIAKRVACEESPW